MHLSVKPDQKIDIHLLDDLHKTMGQVTVTSSLGTRTLVEDKVHRSGV
jgi:hypothetical protein